MLTQIHPKLPMRNREKTRGFYVDCLGFEVFGGNYPDYLMLQKDQVQIHFFLFEDLLPPDNYGQVYIRTQHISELYDMVRNNGAEIHPNGKLAQKIWGMLEFSLLDPDSNLLTFGQPI